ncbi:hypothetical protein [Enterococcus sp. DIV0800]|uniref:hypothetical protein n=1 Tax=unclassified Enterococcus TaxID=2608891 RepID=UPI003D3007C4
MSPDELKTIREFLQTDLLPKSEAIKITDQSPQAFTNAVNTGKITPFYEYEGETSSKIRLYLRSDLEAYAATKRRINK